MIDNLSIIGLGLMGGSLALGAKARGLARSIAAWSRREETLREALRAGAIDRAAKDLEGAVAGADLVVVCVPVLALAPLAMRVHELASPGAVITDVGSTKESVVSAMEALGQRGAAFVGGHPIAGTENSGFAAARADLFNAAPFILTVTARTRTDAAGTVEKLWTGLGCRVYRMSPAEHDRLFALISHLPHLAAYALVGAVFSGADEPASVSQYAGGGFRDFTRIAASDPVMWRDICLDNRRHILHALDLLEGELGYIREAVSAGDGDTLQKIFEKARGKKRST